MGIFGGNIEKNYKRNNNYKINNGKLEKNFPFLNKDSSDSDPSKWTGDRVLFGSRNKEGNLSEYKDLTLLQRQINNETDPFRKEALRSLALYQGAPGESEYYKQGLQQGSADISRLLEQYGLGSSSTASKAYGSLASGLLANEEQQRIGAIESLSNTAQSGYPLLSNIGLTKYTTQKGVSMANTAQQALDKQNRQNNQYGLAGAVLGGATTGGILAYK